MTVSSSTNKVSYSGNGSLTTFAYSFKIFDQDDLTVILRAADGTETTQTITTHYTVSGVGEASGGNVVFGSAPASGVTVVVIREQPLTQGLDLVPNNPFPAESLEEALDKLTFMSQKHEEELSRAIKGSRTNVISNSEFTVSATDRANKVFAFDGSGNLSVTQELGTFKGNWAASTAYVPRDIVKDTSTNNIFIINTTHTSSGSQPLTTNSNSAKYDLIVDAASSTTAQTASASSATAAASSATAAASSATASATAKTASETAKTASETAQAASEAALDSFDDRYLGAKSTSGGNPTVDNDGDALIDGALFFDTTNNVLMVYNLGTTAWLRTTPTSSDQTAINTVNADASDIGTVAGISSNVTTVAGVSANVTSVAAVASLITSDFVSDLNTLATTDIISDLNTLATADIVSDLNTLATSDIVSDLNTLATADIVSDLNTLATTDIVSDLNTLATTDIVTDLNLLATSAIVEDLNLLATSTVIADMATLAGAGANPNISSLAVSGNITLGDSNKIILGASSDLQLFHDGNNSFINNTVTGALSIKSDDINLMSSASETMATFVENGAVTLYHDNAAKLATTATGIDVTGGVSIDDDNNFSFGDGTTYIQGSGANDRIKFIVTSEQMRLTSTGLGIGTSSIGQKLTVDGNIQLGTSSGAGKLYLSSSSGFSPRLQEDSNALAIYTNNSERLRVTNGGRVSIGGTTVTDSNLLNIQGSSASSNIGVVFNDTNTSKIYGIQNGGSDLKFFDYTANAERMRIVSGGDVGISVDPGNPGWARNLHVHGAGNGGGLKLTDNTSGSGNNDGLDIASYQGHAFIINRENADIRFHQNDTEKMRLSNGHLLVGTTNATIVGNGGIGLKSEGRIDASTSGGSTMLLERRTNIGEVVGIYQGGNAVGSISVTASSTNYATSSDHRLKENVADLTGATTRLKQLEPKRFNFIADADTTVDGFLAHEVQSVVPEAITGTHNEVDDDGNPVYQGIDQSKLVPLLVATIKELEARITTLEGA